MAQIGNADDEDKVFASLNPDQNIGTITLEEALKLFLLPKKLGVFEGEEVEVSNGRYGPYVRFGKTFISLEKGEDPLEVNFERAQVLIQMKLKADAPIAVVDGLPVQKGVGRFGPFIKWNDLFINVNKKYNFDNLSKSDIQELIDDKMKKEEEKVLHHWEDENIRVEKARWGRSIIFHGKVKIELPKEIDATKLTLEDVKKRLDALAASKPAKKTVKKVVKKTTSAAKKATKPKATKPKAVKK